MTTAPEDFAITAEGEVSGHETVRPTPDILDALKQDYPLEASIADLVDNSIDAKATQVNIRFVRRGEQLISLCVADDGTGMTDSVITGAMQFGHRRKYHGRDLGMFGVGLKTASLSQAESVIIATRAAGHDAIARRWTREGIKKHDWTLDILTRNFATQLLDSDWGFGRQLKCGTVIRWDQVSDFERLVRGADEYLEAAMRRIRNHLGLKLHRFLEQKRIRIHLDVQDTETGVGPPSEVLALNPFPDVVNSAGRKYPTTFTVILPGAGELTMRGHIWRRKSREAGYRLAGRVAEHQGFYFYRHDRLIQDGGWSGILGTSDPHMSLARVEVDIPDSAGSYLRVRSNKAGVDVPATFGSAVHAARAEDGMTFGDYLEAAEDTYREKREIKAKPLVMPGDGVPADVRKALIRNGAKFTAGRECCIAWQKFEGSRFLSIDVRKRTILLNTRYRKTLLRGMHGGKTDVPLVRTLLYFVFESLLSGNRIGAQERARLEAIQDALNAALRLEGQWTGEQ